MLMAETEGRIDNVYANVNTIGMLAAVGILIQIDEIIQEKKLKLASVFCIPSVFVLALTQSRKAFVVLILNLGYLKAQGFVKPDMVNVLNEMCFPNDMSVSIKKVNENYEYIVDSGSGSEPTVRDCSPGVLLYRDNTLKGADPVLDDELIPVIYGIPQWLLHGRFHSLSSPILYS